ncbi:MAG: site-specific DNA-methyltransferase, partial [Planctomycetota bacterium]
MTTHDAPTPEEFDLRSLDLAAEKRAELLRLFPECATEGGKVDFERLKAALGEQIDAGKERYGLTWPGKAACFQTIQRPSLATLRPKPGESVDFDTTQNVIIEGDNLEVLKLLQKSYLGKVKMIYIDPPYNTGNDFIYPDNYTESLKTYLEYTGQVDGEGRKFSTNTEADGRFHSKWLNMMYPRLYLARNLLREDGVIFISIDDHEVENLRRLCGEVVGEEGFLGCITWQKKYAPANDTIDFSATHDYVAVYARSRKVGDLGEFLATLNREPRTEAMNDAYSNPDGDPRGVWKAGDYTCNKTAEERPNLYYPIIHPKTKQEIWPKKTAVWRYSKEAHARHVAEGRVWWGANGDNRVPAFKRLLTEVGGVVAQTVWLWKDVGHTDEARKGLASLLSDGGDSVFDTPKPVSLIAKMLALATSKENDIILDFFAGSGTTAHAVLEQNKKDGGNRKFLLVQLPEPTGRTDYPTIADITKERVRRVIKNLNDADKGQLRSANDPKPDRGFRVFQLAPSNF